MTTRVGTSSALVPWRPPPCTAMTSSVRPVSLPRGADHRQQGDRRRRGELPSANQFGRWTSSSTAPRAKPICKTTHVIRITPPTRTMPASGPPTWLMPRLASGTPPNGNEKRTASTSVWAAGRPMTRQRPGGAISAATPWNEAKITHDAM